MGRQSKKINIWQPYVLQYSDHKNVILYYTFKVMLFEYYTHYILYWMWTVQISYQWQRHIKDIRLLTDAKCHICDETLVPALSQPRKTGLFPHWTLAHFPAPLPCCLHLGTPLQRRDVPVSMCHSQHITHSFKQFTSAIISSCTKGLHVTTPQEMSKKIEENFFLETLSFDSSFI